MRTLPLFVAVLLCDLLLILNGAALAARPQNWPSPDSSTRDLIYADNKLKLNSKDLDALEAKAFALFQQEKYAEARKVYTVLIKDFIAESGPNALAVINALENSGICAYNLGDIEVAAKELGMSTPKLLKEKNVDPSSLMAAYVLVEVLVQQYRYAEALPVLEAALPLFRERIGQTHGMTATMTLKYAETLQGLNRQAEATIVLEKLMASLAKKPGPHYFHAVNRLAGLYNDDFKNVKARNLILATLPALRKLNNKEREKLEINSLTELAKAWNSLGRYQKALGILENVLPRQDALAGENNEISRKIRQNLALCYAGLGRRGEASPLLEQTLAAERLGSGLDSPQAAKIGMDIAYTYQKLGDFSAAITLAEQALATYTVAYGSTHHATLNARSSLITMYSDLGDYDTALDLCEELLPVMRKVHGPDHPLTLNVLKNQASLYIMREKSEPQKAIPLLEAVIKGATVRLGARHPETLRARMNLARAIHAQKRYAEARTQYVAVLSDARRHLGTSHPDTLELRQNMAALDLDEGKTSEARMELEALLPEARTAGLDFLSLRVMNDLRRACTAQNNFPLAEFYGRQVVDSARKMRETPAVAPQSQRAAFARERASLYQGLADVLLLQGRSPEARGIMSLLKNEELAEINDTVGKIASSVSIDVLKGLDAGIVAQYQEINDRLTSLGKKQRKLLQRRDAGDKFSVKEEARLKQLDADIKTAQTAFTSFIRSLGALLAAQHPGSMAGLDNLSAYQEFLGRFGNNTVDMPALSASQTGCCGADADGKEVEGFGALAQKCGAKAVLPTLWHVCDESTGLLMSRFYALRTEKDLPSAEALRQAQLQIIKNKVFGKNFAHPFYWAPFVLMGDWR